MEEGKELQGLPPGFRFHPTDEELVTYYLANKFSNEKFTGRMIADVDLNKCEPWDLPGKAKIGEKEWYFFSLRDRKYPTGIRANRATNAGYWKTTGKDKEVLSTSTSGVVGMKKTLVFYVGRAPRGEKTNWIIHEYRLLSGKPSKNIKDEWVVCRVFQKSCNGKKYNSSSPRTHPYNLGTIQLSTVAATAEGIDSHGLGNWIEMRNHTSNAMDSVGPTGILGGNWPPINSLSHQPQVHLVATAASMAMECGDQGLPFSGIGPDITKPMIAPYLGLHQQARAGTRPLNTRGHGFGSGSIKQTIDCEQLQPFKTCNTMMQGSWPLC